MDVSAQKVVMAGGSGFLGKYLKRHFLCQKFQVINLTRHPTDCQKAEYREVHWDGKNPGPWQQELEGADVLINLVGKNINCRYTEKNQKEIISSRCDAINILGLTLRQVSQPPRVWLQTVGISIYGDTGETECDEASQTELTLGRKIEHQRFLINVCREWETSFEEALVPGVRKIVMRISSVIGPKQGALKLLVPLAKWGCGGALRPGNQYVSWIHIDDLVAVIDWFIRTDIAIGLYNVTAPKPVTNQEFMRTLRKVLRRPWSPPVPKFALKWGCKILGTEPVLALSGVRAIPRRIEEEGFQFQFTNLDQCLRNFYPNNKRK